MDTQKQKLNSFFYCNHSKQCWQAICKVKNRTGKTYKYPQIYQSPTVLHKFRRKESAERSTDHFFNGRKAARHMVRQLLKLSRTEKRSNCSVESVTEDKRSELLPLEVEQSFFVH